MPGPAGRRSPALRLPLAGDRIQNRRARVEVHRVAELVRLGRAARLDAGGHLARVVPAEAALADRSEQIAQGPVAEEVEALVGDLELERLFRSSESRARLLPPLPIALDIRRGGDVALLLKLLDDLVDELVEARFRVVAILPALAEHLLERLVGQETAVQQRLEDRVVQRLHRSSVLAGHPVRVVEPARQQEIGQPREQLFEVELVEVLAGVLGIAVFHVSTGSARQL